MNPRVSTQKGSIVRRVNLRRVFVASGLAALIILYCVLWVRMVYSPAERTGTDFISPYSAARVAQRWGGKYVYDLGMQQIIQVEVVGFPLAPVQVLMFNHPPYLVPFLVLIVNKDYVASLVRYAGVMVASYLACAAVIAWILRREAWKQRHVLYLLAGILTFYPLFVSLVNIQDSAIMVLGAFLWLAGIISGRDWLAGLGLALTSVRPHVTVLLALPFLFRKRGVFLWFCAGVAALGLVSQLAVGPEGLRAYIRLLFSAAGGQFY